MVGYSDYVVFILGADNFYVSKLIRKKAEELGDMYGTFELCISIAEQFEIYASKYFNYDISTYDIFVNYLDDYEKEIVEFIESNGTKHFTIRSEKDE